VACIINVGLFPLHHEEPRRGIVALEMLYSHDYLQPTVLMEPYFKKPPLHNWLTLLFSGLFEGVNEVSLRLPSVFMSLLTALAIYLLSRRFIGERRAIFSSLIFLTTWTILIGYSTKCEPDVTFTFFVFLSIALWYYLFEKGKRNLAWVSGYLFSSFAFLTKGIPGFAFFLISAFIALFIRKELKSFLSFESIVGIVVGSLPVAIWMFSIPFEEAISSLIGEVTSRSLTSYDFFHALKGIFSFPFRYMAALFPWSFVVLFYFMKDRERFGRLFEDKFLRFVALVVVLNSLIYMLSPGTRLRYLMPIFPFVSIIFACILSDIHLERKRAKRIVQTFIDLLLILGIMSGLLIMGDNYHLVVYTIIFLAFAYFIHYYVFKRVESENIVVLVSLCFFLIRGFYSAYYVPISAFKYPDVRGVAKRIVDVVDGRRLETKTNYLQLCFYVEKFIGKPLRFNPNPDKGVLFLTENPEGRVVEKFSLGKHKFYLCRF